MVSVGSALSPAEARKVKMLAIGSAKRLPQLPDLPAAAESVPGYTAGTWFGLSATGRTPRDVVMKINKDVREIIAYGFAVTMGLELAAFVDTGVAWNTDNQFNTDNTRTGYGVGLRSLVPSIGEVRFDVGVSTDGDFVFHFATWPKMVAERQRLR